MKLKRQILQLRFNFRINGNIFIDPSYQLVNIDNHYINQIDFAEIDERIQNNTRYFQAGADKQ